MPQTEPMTPEVISKLFNKFMTSELPDNTVMIAAMLATEYPKNYENAKREAYGFIEGYRLGVQRDRDILTKAADRHCKASCNPLGFRMADYHCRICPDRMAILAPLDKTDKGE